MTLDICLSIGLLLYTIKGFTLRNMKIMNSYLDMIKFSWAYAVTLLLD